MPLILGQPPPGAPPVPVPTDIPGASLWVRGDMGVTGNPVSAWANQIVGGSAWPAGAQATAGRRPTMTTLNGRACPLFDGVDDSINFVFSARKIPQYTVILVTKQTATGAGTKTIFDSSDFVNFDFADRAGRMLQTNTQRQVTMPYGTNTVAQYGFVSTAAVVHAWRMVAPNGADNTPSSKFLYANGVQVATASDPTGIGCGRDMVVFRFGARGANNQGWNGIIAEIALWPLDLTPTQVLTQSQGMMSRWGIP